MHLNIISSYKNPFGELWINQRTSEFDSPYKFSVKELDSESGYNYFGARYYDSELSNWLSVYTERGLALSVFACRSVDPMADKRSWVSPYSYVQNSPVMRVDPSGALDDNYSVSKDGKVKLEEKTNDKFDMLYTKEDWDSGDRNHGIKVNNQQILADLDYRNVNGGVSIARDYGEGSIDDLFKTYKFAADNCTGAEWALARYNNGGNQYAIWTGHNDSGVPTASALGLTGLIAHVHSHPGDYKITLDELDSMGASFYEDINKFKVSPGYNNYRPDWYQKIHEKEDVHRYVYFPNSSSLYVLTRYTEPQKVTQVTSFRSLYFGVLNHR